MVVVTADEVLLDDVLRLVAAAGREADVARDVRQVRARWRLAPLVLIGLDQLEAAAGAGLARRDDVLAVGTGRPNPSSWSHAVRVGASRVLTLPEHEGAVVEALADTADPDRSPGSLVAVVGGRGGAGASVLAAALAVTAARLDRAVLAVDADPLGGGLDLVFGVEDTPGLRWPDLGEVSGRLSPAALVQALPGAGGVAVLSHQRGRPADPGTDAVLAVIRTGQRGGDLVVVDLPRYVDDRAAAVAAAADLVLVVVPAEVRACAAAATVTTALMRASPAVRLVVRTARGSTLDPDLVSTNLGVPLAGTIRAEPGLLGALDRGEAPGARGRGPLATLSRILLRDLARPGARRAA
ncbi:MAG: septum site-determining protein Ssd [Geodermatophilaceae bacterium]